MTVIQALLVALSLVAVVPSAVLFVQAICARLWAVARRGEVGTTHFTEPNVSAGPAICVLMPAHNEEHGLGLVLGALAAQLDDHVRLLVVVDNCTDRTAQIARELATTDPHVTVIERTDPTLRGKGYALDFGINFLRSNPPDVVVIIDADCAVKPGSIQLLARECLSTGRPTQALDLMKAPEAGNAKLRIAEFAWLVKNHVRPLGFKYLGLPCQLMGTGMAFSWSHISEAKLNNGHIVEDMKLGIELARVGAAPLFLPDALVTSYFPASVEGAEVQRTRWEHGHLGVIFADVPRLLVQSIATGNRQLLALALDLCVPPLSLLVVLNAAFLLLGALSLFVFDGYALLLIAMTSNLMLAVAICLSWLGFGRNVITLKQLFGVPLYVLKKIPLYFYFLIKRQAQWVRAKRDDE